MSRILGVPFQSPLRYLPERTALVPVIRVARLPTTSDQNYPVCQFWLIDRNPTTGTEGDLYYLERFDSSGDAIWTKLADVSGVAGLQQLTGDVGFAVIDASDNIDVVGDATQGVSTAGAANTITVTVADATDTTKGVASFNATDFTVAAGDVTLGDTIVKLVSADAGDATPASNAVTITGAGGITTSAVGDTITITGSATLAGSFVTDVGTATPAANIINILGGTGVNTSGAGSTVTINIDSPVSVANGGTGATTLTDGGILLGSGAGAITVTAQPADGQVLIGSTGTDPVLATLTAGAGIDITNAAGSITIAVDGPLDVDDGGTGAATFTPYAVITAGTTATGAFQNVVGVGTANQVLTSNGAGALPTWQDVSNGSGIVGSNTLFLQSDFVGCDTPFNKGGFVFSAGTYDHMGVGTDPSGISKAITYQRVFVDGGEITVTSIAYMANYSVGRGQIGLTNNTDYVSVTNCVAFVNYSVLGGNIYAITKNGGGATSTDTGIASSTTYRKFEVIVNADATSVVFKIDDATVATHTTNIPANTSAMYAGVAGENLGGSAIGLDFLSVQKTYDGPRA